MITSSVSSVTWEVSSSGEQGVALRNSVSGFDSAAARAVEVNLKTPDMRFDATDNWDTLGIPSSVHIKVKRLYRKQGWSIS